MIDLRQWFRGGFARRMFLLLAFAALWAGALPRWHVHDHEGGAWSHHHHDDHDHHRQPPAPDVLNEGAGELPHDELHLHEFAAAWSGLPAATALPSIPIYRHLFAPQRSYAAPPEAGSLPLIRPPIV